MFFLIVFSVLLTTIVSESMKNRKSGEIIVVGKDSLIIPLHHKPKTISVFVKEHYKKSSCNPITKDKVEWDVIEVSPHHFELKLSWNVANSVTICYNVSF